jgi:anti-sigma factor RsiW
MNSGAEKSSEMFCADFEDRLSDYLEGALDAETHRLFAEHALRCPVCNQTLSQVRNTIQACHIADVLAPPPAELEARILLRTMPETAMTCEEFEESLTDYLDGFLPAPSFHRWERHAALCNRCTELPGEVVRSIGACYTYKSEELPVPAGLNASILEATLGTMTPAEVRAPFSSRLASRLRLWLDPIVSPQLATVATMLLVAVFVLTNTVSADGSISGMYRASLRLAEQSYASGAGVNPTGVSEGVKEFFVGSQDQNPPAPNPPPQKPQDQKPEDKKADQKQDNSSQKQPGAGKGNGHGR